MLENSGFDILPKGDSDYYNGGGKTLLMRLIYFVMAKTVVGDLAACEHCRNSVSEMELLDKEFQKLIDNSNIENNNIRPDFLCDITPLLDYLLIISAEPVNAFCNKNIAFFQLFKHTFVILTFIVFATLLIGIDVHLRRTIFR